MSLFRPVNIRNLSARSLAGAHVRKDLHKYEWITISKGGVLDASTLKDLYIICARCGKELTSGSQCSACGHDSFNVKRLFKGKTVPCPAGAEIRLTGSGANRFLHIDLPQELQRECEIHYTTDGSAPSLNSPLYTRPCGIPNSVSKIRARIYRDDTVSKELCWEAAPSSPKKAKAPAGSYKPQTVSPRDKAFNCSVCGAYITPQRGKARCPRCGKEYKYDPSSKCYVLDSPAPASAMSAPEVTTYSAPSSPPSSSPSSPSSTPSDTSRKITIDWEVIWGWFTGIMLTIFLWSQVLGFPIYRCTARLLGNADMMNEVGHLYEYGYRIFSGYRHSYTMNSDHEEPEGFSYDDYRPSWHSFEVDTDQKKAIEWYKRAADRGNLDAKYHMGKLHWELYEENMHQTRFYRIQNAQNKATTAHEREQLKQAKENLETAIRYLFPASKGRNRFSRGIYRAKYLLAQCLEALDEEAHKDDISNLYHTVATEYKDPAHGALSWLIDNKDDSDYYRKLREKWRKEKEEKQHANP